MATRCTADKDFNSRPSARGDTFRRLWYGYSAFQFTPLREGRPITIHHVVSIFKFQFTPLREGRLMTRIEQGRRTLFQFTPLREGRPTM